MSNLAVNTITDANGGNTAKINTFTPTESNMTGRNRIINGAMEINQRAWSSAAVTDAFTVDRWRVYEQTDGAITAEQSTDAPVGFKNSLKITVTSTDTSLGSTQFARVQQQIEGTNIIDWAFGTASAKSITISFWVKSSLTGTFSAAVRAIGVNRSYPFTYTISSANTWEFKSTTISGDTGGSWDTTTSGGMSLFLTLASGSAYAQPAGAWETSGSSAAEGCVNVLGTNGATIQWTGVQLEVGSVATPFERRDYGTELSLCQRYYYRITPKSSNYFTSGYNNSTTVHRGIANFPTSMRTEPTSIEQSGTAADYSIHHGGSTVTNLNAVVSSFTASVNSSRLSVSVASGLTQGQASMLAANNDTAFLAWSAEL